VRETQQERLTICKS